MSQVIALICPKHGFQKSDRCGECEKAKPKDTLYVSTHDWVKQGEWEHIDPTNPHMKFNSKEELIQACESRGLLARGLMKPKSIGKGWEHARR